MLTPLSSRHKKTLKIFCCLALVNIFLFLLFSSDAPAEATNVEIKDHIEFFVQGELKTSFEENKKVMLVSPSFHHVLGPVYLKSKEMKETGEHFILLVPEKWLKQHLELLSQTKWQIVPYTDGIKSKKIFTKGESYEISY